MLAGLIAFGFARIYGEPPTETAIGFEKATSHEPGETAGLPPVSRGTQSGIGLFTGIVVYAVALGGLFALGFAAVYRRFAALSPRATAAVLALGGFLAVVLIPALKYPPNPPAIGEPGTIAIRTALFFTMIAISLGAAVSAIGLARRLVGRLGVWDAVLLAAGAFVVAIAFAQYLLPDVNEVPEHFPAVVLWRFRIAALGLQAVLWGVLGIAFGVAAETCLRSHPAVIARDRAAYR